MGELGQLIERYGLGIVLLAFITWQLWKERNVMNAKMYEREDRMAARLDTVDDKHVDLINKSNEALNNNTIAMHAICRTLERRPCLKDASGLYPKVDLSEKELER